MAAELVLQLFGTPVIEYRDLPLHFSRKKSLALLVYLVLGARVYSRDTLANVLAADQPDSHARQQLQNALREFTKLEPPLLEIQPQTIGLRRSTVILCDVLEFSASVQASVVAHDMIGLVQAVQLYQGEFLEGVVLRDSPLFEEWLAQERERLRLVLLQGLDSLLTMAIERSAIEVGIMAGQRILALEPARESAHRALMLLYTLHGRRAEAIAQYQRCVAMLRAELWLEPEPATVALFEQIRAPVQIPQHNLPAETNQFVGRETELATIMRWLATPHCRLITLLGLGGSGKTQTALQAARQYLQPHGWIAQPFPDGIYVVYLESLHGRYSAQQSATLIAMAIAEALSLHLESGQHVIQQVLHALGQRQMLLILDNIEQFPQAAPFLSQLLKAASCLKIVVTSRVRLQLQAEWVLDLHGLSLPTNPANLAQSGAGALFLQTMQRLTVQQPADNDLVAVSRICHLVSGLPLAIVLAASWVRTLGCQQLMQELERGLTLLRDQSIDIPERQRSIETVLNWSWLRLAPELQRVLRVASVMHGGFDIAAARTVIGVGPFQLQALHEAMLLTHDASGRYDIHELVRQYAAEQLNRQPAERAHALQQHAQYYVDLLVARRMGAQTDQVMQLIGQESQNVRAAWSWAVRHQRSDMLEVLGPELTHWFEGQRDTLGMYA